MSSLRPIRFLENAVSPSPSTYCFECQLLTDSSGKFSIDSKIDEANGFLSDGAVSDAIARRNLVTNFMSLIAFIRSHRTLPAQGSPLVDWLQREGGGISLNSSIVQTHLRSVDNNVEDQLKTVIQDLVQCSCAHKSLLQRHIKILFMAPTWQRTLSRFEKPASPADIPAIASMPMGTLFLSAALVQQSLPGDAADRLGSFIPRGYDEIFARRLTELWNYVLQPLRNGFFRAHVDPIAFSLGALLPHDSPVELMQRKRKHVIDDKDHWLCTHWLALQLTSKDTYDSATLASMDQGLPRNGKLKICPEKCIPTIPRLKTHMKQEHGYSRDDLRCSGGPDEGKWDELLRTCDSRLKSKFHKHDAELSSLSTNTCPKCEIDSHSMVTTACRSSLMTPDVTIRTRAFEEEKLSEPESTISVRALHHIGSQFLDSSEVPNTGSATSYGLEKPVRSPEPELQVSRKGATVNPTIPSIGHDNLEQASCDLYLPGMNAHVAADSIATDYPLPFLEQDFSLSPPQQPLPLLGVHFPWQSEGSNGDWSLADLDIGMTDDGVADSSH